MKQNLHLSLLSLLLLINITGCSVTRFAETRLGYGVKKANKTDLNLDFQLGFNATDGSLIVTLEYQPHSIYKPRITLTDLGVGLAALGLLGKVFYDNWDHDYTFTFVDDTFDWYGSEPWEKAVLIGVPLDILLYWGFSYPFDRSAVRLQRQPLTEHPYRIELPNHGRIGVDYRTTTGTEQIKVRNFLAELGNPPYLKNIESLKFRASTEVGEKQYRKDYIITGPMSIPNPQVEVDVRWIENRLQSGEKATLKVIVKNTSETILTEIIATTVSSDPNFNNWELKFGSIAQGASETRLLRCSMGTDMPLETVPVFLRFKEANGIVIPEVETRLEIIE